MYEGRPFPSGATVALGGEAVSDPGGDPDFEWRGRTGPFTLALAPRVFRPTHTSLALAEVVDVFPGEVVADVGCGCGVLAFVAARLGAARVVGTDINPAAVRVATANARRLGLHDRADFRTGHLLEPFAATSFDVVLGDVSGIPDLLSSVTGWLPGGGPTGAELPVAMLEGMRSALRPGGRLYLPTASIQDEERILTLAGRAFASVELLATRQFPLPGPVSRSEALAALVDAGVVRVESRGSRRLWRLRLWCCRQGSREAGDGPGTDR